MQAGSSPKATVVFDGDQTLWDFRSAMVRALGETRIEIARVAGIPLESVPSIDELIATRDRVARDTRNGTLAQIRRAAFVTTLNELGRPLPDAAVDRITEFYSGRRYELCRPYPDTAPALSSLGEQFRVVLLTNGNSYPERMGLRSMFDRVFVGEELAALKPEPAVYARVADECGGDVFVSVGDALMNDVVAPQRAGWLAIWVNREGRVLPPQVTPDAMVTNLVGLDVELARIIAK